MEKGFVKIKDSEVKAYMEDYILNLRYETRVQCYEELADLAYSIIGLEQNEVRRRVNKFVVRIIRRFSRKFQKMPYEVAFKIAEDKNSSVDLERISEIANSPIIVDVLISIPKVQEHTFAQLKREIRKNMKAEIYACLSERKIYPKP